MTDKRIQNTREYIHSFLNDKIFIRQITDDIQKILPIVIKSNYDCYSAAIMGIDICLCFAKDEKSITPSKIQLHLQMLAQLINKPCIIVLEDIPSYNIKRLIDQRVNFIIIGKQMFVPSLMLDLRKMPAKDKDIKDQIPPLAQCMILYVLQIGYLTETISELTEQFGVSYSTANRAVRWLQSKGFIFTGRANKNIQFLFLGYELWDKALPHLISPIEKTIKTNSRPANTLLSDCSVFSDDMKTCAIYKDGSKNIPETINGDYTIEVWKYNPMILSKDKKHVDSLSLYLSLKDNTDNESIAMVNRLLEEVKLLSESK
jgi:hypothetical protein